MVEQEHGDFTSLNEFLETCVQDYRYEKSPLPNEIRLYHCRPDGTQRFGLYFCAYEKSKLDGPYELKVHPSCISAPAEPVIVYARFEGGKVFHYSPESAQEFLTPFINKICFILNERPPSANIHS